MKKLNNKGMTVVEIVLTFSIIMVIVIGMLTIVVNYRGKISVSLTRLKLESNKNTLTQGIYNDILKLGVEKIEDFSNTSDTTNKCYILNPKTGLHEPMNRCIVITFQDGSQKALATSKVLDSNNKDQIINKYIYYDGLRYKIKDTLPKNKPISTENKTITWEDLQSITINDDGILTSNYDVLEDGTQVYIYNIDIGISHIDYEDDFGLHIVASTIDVSE